MSYEIFQAITSEVVKWITLADAARRVGLKPKTFYNQHSRHALPFPVYMVGNRVMVLIEDVDKWMRSCKI